MSDVTEVYSCYEGQGLKEGKLDYSNDIHDKEAAQSDAEKRCQRDKAIHRVAYYAVDANRGRFRNFYTYTNPNPAPQKKAAPLLGGGGGKTAAPPGGAGGGGKPRPPAGKPGTAGAKPSLKQRIVAFFMEDI